MGRYQPAALHQAAVCYPLAAFLPGQGVATGSTVRPPVRRRRCNTHRSTHTCACIRYIPLRQACSYILGKPQQKAHLMAAWPFIQCSLWRIKKPAHQGWSFKKYQFRTYSATTSNSTSVLLPLPKSTAALKVPSSFTSSSTVIRRRSIS